MDCPSALPVRQLGDALDIRAPHTHADVSEVGREVGIVFGEKGEPADPVDTSLAHRAVLLYDEDPRQRAVAAALFAAHFERGQSLADLSTVVSAVVMAAEDDPVSVRDRLVSGEGEDRLDADRMQAQLMGITTLPAYAVGGRTVLLGDQSTEQLRRLVAHDRVLQIA
jgi:predicted DsbA family dithiol-disulfide isomerase